MDRWPPVCFGSVACLTTRGSGPASTNHHPSTTMLHSKHKVFVIIPSLLGFCQTWRCLLLPNILHFLKSMQRIDVVPKMSVLFAEKKLFFPVFTSSHTLAESCGSLNDLGYQTIWVRGECAGTSTPGKVGNGLKCLPYLNEPSPCKVIDLKLSEDYVGTIPSLRSWGDVLASPWHGVDNTPDHQMSKISAYKWVVIHPDDVMTTITFVYHHVHLFSRWFIIPLSGVFRRKMGSLLSLVAVTVSSSCHLFFFFPFFSCHRHFSLGT